MDLLTPQLKVSGCAGCRDLWARPESAKVTASIRVEDGVGMGRRWRYREARDRSSEIMQNHDGESRAPKTIPMGMMKKAPRTKAFAAARSGW